MTDEDYTPEVALEEATQMLRHFLAILPSPLCTTCCHPWEMHRTGEDAGCDGSPSAKHDDPPCTCPDYLPAEQPWFVKRAREVTGMLLPPHLR